MRTSSIACSVAIWLVLPLTAVATAEEPSFRYLTNGELLIAKVADANEYLAYNKHSGAWKRHTFAKGITAIPVLSHSICVFAQRGEGITEFVGVDSRGNWRTTKLPSPATEYQPLVSDSVAVIVHDGRSYAFSAITGTWDSVPTTVPPALETDLVVMKADDSIAVFSAQTGRWSEVSLKSKAQ